MDLDVIHCGDSLEVLKTLPDSSIDLVVTSPPYNIKNSTGNGFKYKSKGKLWENPSLISGYDKHGDNMPHSEYVEWQRNILSECMRLLSDEGAIFYNHKWRVQAGLLQDRQDIMNGFPVRQIIIWQRSGGINFNPGYFLPTYEVIYVIAKKGFKLKQGSNKHGDVWNIRQEVDSDHPAPFPLELPTRIISSTSAKVVLDPFMGSGTTGLACKKLGVHYIGIDNSPEYCEMARKRIDAVNNYSPIYSRNKVTS